MISYRTNSWTFWSKKDIIDYTLDTLHLDYISFKKFYSLKFIKHEA